MLGDVLRFRKKPISLFFVAICCLLIVLLYCGFDRYQASVLLIKAVKEGNVAQAIVLLRRGANPNQRFPVDKREDDKIETWTFMNYITFYLGQRDYPSQTILYSATTAQRPSMVRLLLNSGAEIDSDSVFYSSGFGSSEILQSYLDRGVSPDLALDGTTLLMNAANSSSVKCVAVLLKHGAKVNLTDKQKRTALMFAAETRNVDCVRLLLEHGADPRLIDIRESDASHYAQNIGDRKIINIIRRSLDTYR